MRFQAKEGALTAPIGEAGHINPAKKPKFADFFYSSHFACKRSKNPRAISIGLAQHKGNEKIGKARKSFACWSRNHYLILL
jgi:hypothetical protein